jgi:hypothetical protein
MTSPPELAATPASERLTRASRTTPRPVRATADAQPVPPVRFGGAIAAGVYALMTLLLGAPALAGQFLVTPRSDQYLAGFAFREFAASWARTQGGVPLWNPYLMGGVPHVAAMAGDIFYPPSMLLRLLLPADAAITWGLMLHVFLAGCFSYLFLRRALGLGFAGALVGGLAYMAGGNVAGLVSPGHDGKIYVAALLPLILYLLHRGVRDGRAWSWGALAIAVTFAILTPHPQLLQYLLLVAGGVRPVRRVRRRSGRLAPRPRRCGAGDSGSPPARSRSDFSAAPSSTGRCSSTRPGRREPVGRTGSTPSAIRCRPKSW